jgi:hypothetical protein
MFCKFILFVHKRKLSSDKIEKLVVQTFVTVKKLPMTDKTKDKYLRNKVLLTNIFVDFINITEQIFATNSFFR